VSEAKREEYDFAVIGSGGGSMCAALYLDSIGKSTLILEKTDKVGGSTAMSGGVLWIPNNDVMRRDGIKDSQEAALTYMEAVVGASGGAASSPARRQAYVSYGPEVIRFLESRGVPFRRPGNYADYYNDRAGGVATSRALVVPLFNLRELGPWQEKLRRLPAFALPMSIEEFNEVAVAKTTWKGRWKALLVAIRFAKQKLLDEDWVGCGCALQGRMLQAALQHEIPIYLNTPVEEILMEEGRAVGVRVSKNGETTEIRARDGVLINAGGFARNAAMRNQYGPQPSSADWTNANPGDTGEMINEAMRLGAGAHNLDDAWWVPVSKPPFDLGINPIHVSDIAKPHAILVDSNGERFTNEAGSYMEIGQRMYERNKKTPAVPCYMILDQKNRDDYPLFIAPPGSTPKQWLDTGYVVQAETLSALAKKCGIHPEKLKATVARFNEMVRKGKDEDYHRGARSYDGWYGDPANPGSPTLGTLEKAPFYAVKVYPGDVGTSGGVITDQYARVLTTDGAVIPGLYATGNSTASVMGRTYPGAGASIGASFVFGYIAAKHAAGLVGAA
jgi:3-oxosteroid 1-dehydrogenase